MEKINGQWFHTEATKRAALSQYGCNCDSCCTAFLLYQDTFTEITTFATIPIGGEFIEGLTSVNEIATRIEPATHKGRPVNARRAGGKLVLMVDWEPVFIDKEVMP